MMATIDRLKSKWITSRGEFQLASEKNCTSSGIETINIQGYDMNPLSTMSTEELTNLQAQIAEEIEQRTNTSRPQRIAVPFGSYNARRYSKPWLAKVVSWTVGHRPELLFGSYIGTDEGGEAEIMARPGDIVRFGQKDNRRNASENDWGVVQDDGTIRKITQVEARALFDA